MPEGTHVNSNCPECGTHNRGEVPKGAYSTVITCYNCGNEWEVTPYGVV